MSHMSDRAFIEKFSWLVGGLAVLTFVFFVLAQIMGSQVNKEETAEMKAEAKAVAERISPVGRLKVADKGKVMDSLIPAANAAGSGKAVYEATCSVCHKAGVAGAPKFGDKAAWKDRIAKGKDTLYEHALKGFQGTVGFMPAKGGNTNLSDQEVKAAVDHMVENAK